MQVRGHFDFTENYEGNCFGHGGNRQVYTYICLFPPAPCTLAFLLVFLHAIELLEALSKTLAKPINFSSLGVVLLDL